MCDSFVKLEMSAEGFIAALRRTVCLAVNCGFTMQPDMNGRKWTFEPQHLPLQACFNTKKPCIEMAHTLLVVITLYGSQLDTGNLIDCQAWNCLVSIGMTLNWGDYVKQNVNYTITNVYQCYRKSHVCRHKVCLRSKICFPLIKLACCATGNPNQAKK